MLDKIAMVAVIGLSLLAELPGCGPQPAATPATTMAADKGMPIAIGDLPQTVVEGVQKAMPGAVLTKAKKTSDGNYHLSDVKLGKQEYMLTVAPDGTVLKKEDDDD